MKKCEICGCPLDECTGAMKIRHGIWYEGGFEESHQEDHDCCWSCWNDLLHKVNDK